MGCLILNVCIKQNQMNRISAYRTEGYPLTRIQAKDCLRQVLKPGRVDKTGILFLFSVWLIKPGPWNAVQEKYYLGMGITISLLKSLNQPLELTA